MELASAFPCPPALRTSGSFARGGQGIVQPWRGRFGQQCCTVHTGLGLGPRGWLCTGTALPQDEVLEKAPCLEAQSYPLPFLIPSCLEVGAESKGAAGLPRGWPCRLWLCVLLAPCLLAEGQEGAAGLEGAVISKEV